MKKFLYGLSCIFFALGMLLITSCGGAKEKSLILKYGETEIAQSNQTLYLEYDQVESFNDDLKVFMCYDDDTTKEILKSDKKSYQIIAPLPEENDEANVGLRIQVLINYKSFELKFVVEIVKKTPNISISNSLDKVWDGTSVADPIISKDTNGNVSFSWYAEDNTLLDQKPTEPGTYILKINTNETSAFFAGEKKITFVIDKIIIESAPKATIALVEEEISGTYAPNKTLADYESELQENWKWKDPSIVPVCNNNGYVAVYNPDPDHYYGYERTIKAYIEKANAIDYIGNEDWPSDYVDTTYNLLVIPDGNYYDDEVNTVGDVELPDGFEWSNSSDEVLLGKNEYNAKAVNYDTSNYNIDIKIRFVCRRVIDLPQLSWDWKLYNNECQTNGFKDYEHLDLISISRDSDDFSQTNMGEYSVFVSIAAGFYNYYVFSKDDIGRDAKYEFKWNIYEYNPNLKFGYIRVISNDIYGLVEYTGSDEIINIPATASADNHGTNPIRVNFINANTFKDNTNIKEVNLESDGVTTIKSFAFSGCTNLEKINLNEVTTVEANAFEDCTSLKEITLEQNDVSLGKQSFANCTGLIQVNVNELVLEEQPFTGCSENTRFNLISGNSWKTSTIRYGAGDGDDGLTANMFNPLRIFKKLYLNNELVTSVVVDGESDFVYAHCESITSLEVNNTINPKAFLYMPNITSITGTKASNNTIIENNKVIFGCANSILPNDGSITTIGSYAITGYSPNQNLFVIPEGVTTLEENSLLGLKKIQFPVSITNIADNNPSRKCALNMYTEGYFASAEDFMAFIENNRYSHILEFIEKVYINNELVENFVIPESVDTVNRCFEYVKCFKSIIIPSHVIQVDISMARRIERIIFEDTANWYRTYSYGDYYDPIDVSNPEENARRACDLNDYDLIAYKKTA